MKPELKPCPFCGGTNLNIRKGKYMWWVECCNADCSAKGGYKSLKKVAIEAWNRRVGNRPAPKLMPMGAYTYAIACGLCKNNNSDKCLACITEVESGFEMDFDKVKEDMKNGN